jgi:hypothetical protein
MRKLLLLTAMALFVFAGTSNAQIFSEDFESGVTAEEPIALDGWLNVAEEGTRVWEGRTYSENTYAQFSSFNSEEVNQAWLLTPAIDVSGAANPVFSFDVNVGYWTHDALTVWISGDYTDDVYSATWDDVTANFTVPQEPTDGYGDFASAGSMDVSTYTGTIHIAFQYDGDDTDGADETTTIQVDNVVVEEAASVNDLAAGTVSVFPNPTYGDINLSSETTLKSVEILNIIGQTVMTRDASANQMTISAGSLTSGVYFVKTTDVDGKTNITKVIKK